jgi:uncharacterized membrane protein
MASLVLGIIGLMAWIFPLVGFPVTIVGLILGVKGLKNENNKTALAGMILSIIGLVATIVSSTIGAFWGYYGYL